MIIIKRLTLDQVERGMVLMQDVCSSNGTCLLPQGTIMSSATLASLRRREVDYVMVAVEEILNSEQYTAMEANIRTRVERLFDKAGTDPLMLKLRGVLLQYRLAALYGTSPPTLSED